MEAPPPATSSTVCVTGAGGFLASWLVKLLLSKDHYVINGTARPPGEGKNAHLKALENAGERLRLFKADVLDYGSVAAAIAGCDGVFHVASPVTSGRPTNPEVDIIATAVTGTLNVLRASHEAKVKRVVVVSSVVAVFNNPNWPTGEPFNEDSWSDEETCRKNEEWYPYYLSNTLAEREAFEYAAKTGMDIVTICPALIIGPLMQPTVPTSIEVFFHIIKVLDSRPSCPKPGCAPVSNAGDNETAGNRLETLLDVRDVADAILLVYENSGGSERYICSSTPRKLSDIINTSKSLYPAFNYPQNTCLKLDEEQNTRFSSEKLEKLGWTFRPMEETLRDSFESYIGLGILT
ncbi:cinnamoyl-CoA reductase 1 [Oryza sativa Japonica Group]|uniref:cinnamoyl-CoA reductase 1 n=1 Tax=Oryza sativa subsp. japonica TaxID=39947 RepID=UPI000E1B7172|nr:cinnamoyl-CoA reductase 2 [Oryza sativa Japonica Group]